MSTTEKGRDMLFDLAGGLTERKAQVYGDEGARFFFYIKESAVFVDYKNKRLKVVCLSNFQKDGAYERVYTFKKVPTLKEIENEIMKTVVAGAL